MFSAKYAREWKEREKWDSDLQSLRLASAKSSQKGIVEQSQVKKNITK